MTSPNYGATTKDPRNGRDHEFGPDAPASLHSHENTTTTNNASQGGSSSVLGAVFNFTKSIVGAGLTGLGGAFASSGGIVSIGSILFFGVLSKMSFDLLIQLSIETTTTPEGSHSYEDLGYAAGGNVGRIVVLLCKGLYTFGSMVAYMVIVKDNFASAISHLLDLGKHHVLNQQDDPNSLASFRSFLLDENATTILISTLVILPLCLLRDLKPLEKFSLTGILTMIFVVIIVIYLYFTSQPDLAVGDSDDVYVHWFQIRSGLVQSLGTFVFTFIAQHTVHLTFESLRPDIRDLNHWKLVSSISMLVSTAIALLAGLFVYMTFWSKAKSSMFALYHPSPAIDIAKILLTLMISLTYPLCLLSCREIIIVSLTSSFPFSSSIQPSDETTTLLLVSDNNSYPVRQRSWLLPGHDRQLSREYHVLLTVALWSITLFLALVAPSFGDVLNLVGCAMGTAIAFILPAIFSFLILGYNHEAAFILAVGCPVGIIGTYFSFIKLVSDAQASYVLG